ncbi:thiopeptide-type bacteriocin biosynthesis protein [Elizabethkingia sp. M8]|uniref:thiopeptide-type bacteriocin biosynthesis protein n=1 Tax=Elizabethkingia sp. M8 TaxID=2796140 RepID=UPI001903CBA8|nr:thiopeptide-type bacteriocin biosynthesis protein [Elizabethkingia sp. M8]QQM25854.1 thiopeptide-type bacteriocin biosynthesis protein [Elizabethkingia sp. M8]
MKIYSSPFFADKILSPISEYINALIEKKIIEKFFFIRYSDPDFHIRLRLKLFDKSMFSTIITDIHAILNKDIQNKTVEIKLESYKRELERYTPELIDDIETLFFYNSLSTLNLLKRIEENALDDCQRWQFGLFYIDNFLSLFEMSIEEKLEFVKLNNESFSVEFNKNKLLNKQLNKKYRTKKESIDTIFINETYKDTIYNDFSAQQQIIQNINDKKERKIFHYILSSIIHMDCNRLFRDEQRKHEYVLYDFLYRYYKKLAFTKNELC